MADFSQWWWQAADAGPGPGPGPDAGDPIGQSLRFRGNQRLTRTFAAGDSVTFTLSFWVKRGDLAGNNNIFRAGNDPFEWMTFTPESKFSWYNSTNLIDKRTSSLYRDPAAWYHFTLIRDGNNTDPQSRVRYYINNVEPSVYDIQTVPGQGVGGLINTAVEHAFGSAPNGSEPFDGYLAAVYFIDGQALEPTTFGRFNSQGVWVPVDPDGLTYGSNGFKLTFEDPSNIGKDYSPNSNDFQAIGFDLSPAGIWSNDLWVLDSNIYSEDPAGLTKNFIGSNPATNAFDGDVTTPTSATGNTVNDGWLIWLPNNDIENVTRLRIASTPTGFIRVNGVNITDTTPALPQGSVGSPNWIEINNPPATITSIGVSGNNSVPNIQGFEINGTILVDSTGGNYDLMQDSPTQNWATLNPLGVDYPAYFPKTKDANLAGDTSGSEADLAMFNTIALPPGKWYYEATFTSDLYLGVAEVFNNSNNRVAYVAKSGTIIREGTFAGSTESTSIGVLSSGTVACKVDADAREIAFSTDGNTWDTATYANPQSGVLYVYFSAGISQPSNGLLAINFGQKPFIYTPPAGFEALQTQNMPTPAILDGRDHFQAITGPGDVGGQAYDEGNIGMEDPVVLTTPIPPNTSNGTITKSQVVDLFSEVTTVDIVWNSSSTPASTFLLSVDGLNWRVHSTAEVTAGVSVTYADGDPFRYVRIWRSTGKGNGIRAASGLNILGLAQQAFPNGLWWIKDRTNDNNHQLVDSVRGQVGGNWQAIWCNTNRNQQDYIAPAGSSVAWCWNAPDTFTGTGGSIASTGRTNDTAGFSIVTYTGTGSAGTVAHGLSAAPEFVIYSNYSEDVVDIPVYHSGLAVGSNLYLNGTNPQANNGKFPQSPDANLLHLGSINDINGSGDSFIAYCWHSVENYSSIGVYEGNSNEDGPFIYTGFAVSFLLFKRLDGNFSWEIRDTARTPNNPNNYTLYPNESWKEAGPDPATDIDLLSNGFKIRNTTVNGNQGNLIYAAFASCPFQSPATAR